MKNFLVGLTLGIGLGLLFAPAAGEETRRRLAEGAEDLAQDLAEQGRQKAAEMVELGRERAGEIGRKAGQQAFDEVAKKVVGEQTVDRSRQGS